MKKTRKLLYSLYAAGIVAGASALTGCVTRTVYVYPNGYQSYSAPRPRPTYTPPPVYRPIKSNGGANAGPVVSGVLQGLSGLHF